MTCCNPQGRVPRTLDCILSADLCDVAIPGTYVQWTLDLADTATDVAENLALTDNFDLWFKVRLKLTLI